MHNVTQLINTNNYKTIYYAGLSAIALSSFSLCSALIYFSQLTDKETP